MSLLKNRANKTYTGNGLNTNAFVFISEIIKHRASVLVVVPEYETTPHIATIFFLFGQRCTVLVVLLRNGINMYLPTDPFR